MSRLSEAGVPIVCGRYDGMVHGFIGMHDYVDKVHEALVEAIPALRTGFGT